MKQNASENMIKDKMHRCRPMWPWIGLAAASHAMLLVGLGAFERHGMATGGRVRPGVRLKFYQRSAMADPEMKDTSRPRQGSRGRTQANATKKRRGNTLTIPPKAEITGSELKEGELMYEAKAISSDGIGAEAVAIRRERPQLLSDPSITAGYPAQAKRMMVEGTVLLRLGIDEAGRVFHAEVLSGPSFGLRQAAIELAKRLSFLPATDDGGAPIRAEVDHEVVFRLRRS